MSSTQRQLLLIGAGLVVLIVGVFWYNKAKAPVSTSTTPESSITASTTTPTSTTPKLPTQKTPITQFPINPADTITSWSFHGAYTGNDTLVAKASADSAHLTSLLGTGQYDDYDLYIGLGNDANLIGDGKNAYTDYNRAIAIHPNKGLAYDNLGHLMDELGAYHTAALAYAKGVMVEPSVVQYRNAQMDFLDMRFPQEAARLKAAQ